MAEEAAFYDSLRLALPAPPPGVVIRADAVTGFAAVHEATGFALVRARYRIDGTAPRRALWVSRDWPRLNGRRAEDWGLAAMPRMSAPEAAEGTAVTDNDAGQEAFAAHAAAWIGEAIAIAVRDFDAAGGPQAEAAYRARAGAAVLRARRSRQVRRGQRWLWRALALAAGSAMAAAALLAALR